MRSTAGLNVDIDSFFELAELIVGVSYGTYGLLILKHLHQGFFIKGILAPKWGFSAKNASTKKVLVQMFQLMILNSLSVY